MSEEEMRHKMEFIVNQQAQFTVDLQRLRETQEAEAKLWREKYNGLTDAVVTVIGIVGKLAERVDGLVERVEEIAAARKRADERSAETEERLNIFINVVERYISEGRNGRAPNGDSPASS